MIAIATIINYIDRQSLNVLWPEISVELFPESSDDERKEIKNGKGTMQNRTELN